MDYDEMKTTHEVDQAIAGSIELGNIRIVGQNAEGQDLMELTSKGVTRTVGMLINSLVATADTEKRDFTDEEKHELAGHLINAITALQK